MKKVDLYTDGACSGNPGRGGYGVLLRYKTMEREISAGYRHTTNNRMELLAVICGLEMLKEPFLVDVYSDSQYVVNAIQKGWMDSWRKKAWMRGKEPMLNADLWQQLDKLLHTHTVVFHWIRGHAGHSENERCDRLATAARDGNNLLVDSLYEELTNK